MKGDRYEVSESRSVRTPWVWRGFVMMALLAVGIVIVLASNGARTFFVAAWAVIAAGWFGIGMWLWHQHNEQYKK